MYYEYAYLPVLVSIADDGHKKGEKKLCPFDPLPNGNIIHLFLIDCNQPYLFLIFFLKEIDKDKIKDAFRIWKK